VVAEGARLAGIGVALGLVGAVAASRVLEGMLFAMPALDPLTFVGAAFALTAAAVLASYLRHVAPPRFRR
jgi:hypothetical protein